MDIVWFGQSCFRLQSSQATVLTDPFQPLPPAALSGVDIVTISDRSRRATLQDAGAGRVVDGPGEYEIKGVPVTGIAAPSAEAADGTSAGKTFIYTVVLDGITVCHLGRAAALPTGSHLQEIGQPDVLLIPLGGTFGMTAARAVQLASQLEAKLLVPMTAGQASDTAVLEAFCKELGADPHAVEERVSVTATGLAAQTRVALLASQGIAQGTAQGSG